MLSQKSITIQWTPHRPWYRLKRISGHILQHFQLALVWEFIKFYRFFFQLSRPPQITIPVTCRECRLFQRTPGALHKGRKSSFCPATQQAQLVRPKPSKPRSKSSQSQINKLCKTVFIQFSNDLHSRQVTNPSSHSNHNICMIRGQKRAAVTDFKLFTPCPIGQSRPIGRPLVLSSSPRCSRMHPLKFARPTWSRFRRLRVVAGTNRWPTRLSIFRVCARAAANYTTL